MKPFLHHGIASIRALDLVGTWQDQPHAEIIRGVPHVHKRHVLFSPVTKLYVGHEQDIEMAKWYHPTGCPSAQSMAFQPNSWHFHSAAEDADIHSLLAAHAAHVRDIGNVDLLSVPDAAHPDDTEIGQDHDDLDMTLKNQKNRKALNNQRSLKHLVSGTRQ